MSVSVNVCSYKGCTVDRWLNKERSCFLFPVKEIERSRKWIEICDNPLLEGFEKYEKLRRYFVCDLHFNLDDLRVHSKCRVRKKGIDPLPNYTRDLASDKPKPPKIEQPLKMRTGSRRAASKEALKQLQKISETELAEQAVETMILSDDDDVVVQVPQNDAPSKTVCTCGAFAKSGNQCTVCGTIYHMSCSSRKLFCCTGGRLAPTHKVNSYGAGTPKKRNSITGRTVEEVREEIVIEEDSSSEGKQNLGVDNPALNLSVSHEALSMAQLAAQQRREQKLNLMMVRIENLLKQNNAEVVYEGEGFQAFVFEGPPTSVPKIGGGTATTSATPVLNEKVVSKVVAKANVASSPAAAAATSTPAATSTQSGPGLSFVVDPRSGQVVGTVSANSQTLAATSRKRRNFNSPAATAGGPQSKILKVGNTTPAAASPSVTPSNATPQKTQNGGNPLSLSGNKQTPIAPKHTSVAAVVDLTAEDTNSTPAAANSAKPSADTKEVAFNKIQGKTFPSLVVVARPNLNIPPVASPLERSKLDMRVKTILVYQPSKFTEWLIQQGLVKSEQYCPVHVTTRLKLGMYSDAAKFPFSGGYVWISDCCPQKFISVFSGSVFEGSPHPPSVIIKLMYHWACQTNVQNVIQWVKVENLYVKGLYTWLRAVCTVGLHSHLDRLGGCGIKVEIGVISLGTTSQDGHQRQVKVEVLGILETETKRLRLRAVEPLTDSDKLYKKRFSKILEPLYGWVHPESTIVTDQTVDRGTLQSMGFMSVQQSVGGQGNHRIMDYLRKIVPRMFQNTLSLLSRQIIQQFLDELVWREWFGTTPADAFDNIILHLSEQTRSDGRQALMIKLNKVATNPFKNWSINHLLSEKEDFPQIPQAVGETVNRKLKRKTYANTTSSHDTLKPPKTTTNSLPDYPENMVNLENYYYGTIDDPNNNLSAEKVVLDFRCHLCKAPFTNNLELMRHYFKHAHNLNDGFQCHYCLESVSSRDLLLAHIQEKHPSVTKNPLLPDYMCVICAHPFATAYQLGKHMSNEHQPSELPYQCGSCGFRSSSHKETVDHFHSAHNNQNVLQCPFCLKSSVITLNSRNTAQHLHHFFQHLLKHRRKAVAKRCKRCCLWFVQKDAFGLHVGRMHESVRRSAGLKPWPVEHNGLMVPRSVSDGGEEEQEEVDISGVVMVDVPKDAECKECGGTLGTSHYEAVLSCTNENCQYVTCCKRAMDTHLENCTGFFKMRSPQMLLPFEMFCVCGYRDKDGNSMAKHLAVCERTSAYPTREAAKSATVTHSMLDVLGLVRRPEEQQTAAVSDSNSDSEATNNKKKLETEAEEENSTEKTIGKEISNSESDKKKNSDSESDKEKNSDSENSNGKEKIAEAENTNEEVKDGEKDGKDEESQSDNEEKSQLDKAEKPQSDKAEKPQSDKAEKPQSDKEEKSSQSDEEGEEEEDSTKNKNDEKDEAMDVDDAANDANFKIRKNSSDSNKKSNEINEDISLDTDDNILQTENDLEKLLQVNDALADDDLDCAKTDDLAEMLLAN